MKNKRRVFVGLADIGFSSRGSNLIIVSDSREKAEMLLLKAYNQERKAYNGEPFKTFNELNEWNGASVSSVLTDLAVIWEQLS